jgi:magnesium chelatase family protein
MSDSFSEAMVAGYGFSEPALVLGSPMLAKLHTFALLGIDAVPVEVEVDAAPGQIKTILVGLPEMAVRESVHRIERALANLGYFRPSGRTIINLAPADLRKDAGAFDLPIALGLLVATRQLSPEQLESFASVGELALDETQGERGHGHKRGPVQCRA